MSSRYSHIANNKKKQYIQEVRYTEIERENRLLLEKIHNIIKKPSDISYRKNSHFDSGKSSFRRGYLEKFRERSKQSVCESESSWDTRTNSQDLIKAKPVVVLQGKKKIGKRTFNVKILEFKDKVKILMNDQSDTFRLIVNSADIFPDFAWNGDWVGLLSSISMENDQLVLCLKPFEEG
jgi:hypothetical protein